MFVFADFLRKTAYFAQKFNCNNMIFKNIIYAPTPNIVKTALRAPMVHQIKLAAHRIK
jgi:hypothetical protein